MRKSRKLVSILLTLTLLATLLIPLATPAAAGTITSTVSVPSITSGNNKNLGTLRVEETVSGSMYNNMLGDEITVDLPSGITYMTTPAGLAGYVQTPADAWNTIQLSDISFVRATNTSLTIRVNDESKAAGGSGTPHAAIEFLYSGTAAVSNTGASGDIKVLLWDNQARVTSGYTTIAKAVSSGTYNLALSTETITEGTNKLAGQIRLTENSAAAFVSGQAISFTLPEGIEWNSGTTATISFGALSAPVFDTNSSGKSRMKLTPSVTSPAPASITIVARYNVLSTAKKGDVTVDIGGDNTGVTSGTVVNATVGDFSVAASAVSTPEIMAGRRDASIGEIKMVESVPASILGGGRTITFNLPSNAKWNAIPTIVTDSGTIAALPTVPGATVTGSDRRSLSYTTGAAPSTSALTIRFISGSIDVDADTAAGDIECTIGGTAGVSGTVKLAKITKAVTAEATSNNVVLGLQAQKAGEITLKETAAGAIMATPSTGVTGQIALVAPSGVSFSKAPTVEVTEGDLKLNLNSVSRANDNRYVYVDVVTSSSTASTIKFSDIALTVTRDVPEGDVTLKVRGNGVDQINFAYNNAGGQNDAAAVVAAKVTTPAPVQSKGAGMFLVGQNFYSVNGTMMLMDVAPYIKDGRTYVPVRYLAYACGLSDNDIQWDNDTQTVTLTKGDKVVTLVIGSKTLKAGDTETAMDVAPEMKNARTMLPARYVAEAFGANVSWSADTQSVGISF